MHCSTSLGAAPDYGLGFTLPRAIGTVRAAEILFNDRRIGASEALGRAGIVHEDYRTRFARAYDLEVQAWADAARAGHAVGPSAWDGYAATAVSTAGMKSLRSGGAPVAVTLPERPGLYAGDH